MEIEMGTMMKKSISLKSVWDNVFLSIPKTRSIRSDCNDDPHKQS